MENAKMIKARGKKTQETIANLCGVAQQTYSNWENGYIPPLRKMLILEEVLGVAKEELFPEIFNQKNRLNKAI